MFLDVGFPGLLGSGPASILPAKMCGVSSKTKVNGAVIAYTDKRDVERETQKYTRQHFNPATGTRHSRYTCCRKSAEPRQILGPPTFQAGAR
jgi:hypothetical protein